MNTPVRHFGYCVDCSQTDDDAICGQQTLCGSSEEVFITFDVDSVTCPTCVRILIDGVETLKKRMRIVDSFAECRMLNCIYVPQTGKQCQRGAQKCPITGR